MKRFATIGAFLACHGLLLAQSFSLAFRSVQVGTDRLAHVVRDTGQEIVVKKRPGQVDVSSPRLSEDKRLAGWVVLEQNCCTSYPIPTAVAIYSGRKTRYLGDGKMVVGWCFVSKLSQVAVATETVHGWTGPPDMHLYDLHTGKPLQTWNGSPDAAIPTWALCLKQSSPELFD